jgi:Protein of unknown function (DUF2889)
MQMRGRSRDIETGEGGDFRVLAEDTMEATIGPERAIVAIACAPERPGIGDLLGARGGSGFRSAVDAALPDDRLRRTPLALLLDDVAGSSLVGGFAWSRHSTDWMNRSVNGKDRAQASVARRTMVGICAGFRPGSATLSPDGTATGGGQQVVAVPPLADPDDVAGWHLLPQMPEIAMRRARRMDVWRDANLYRVDAHFRDSCSDPVQREVAVHEYSISAAVDAAELVVTELVATPRVLPYAECPAAAPNVGRLVGQPLGDLRIAVLDMLRGVDCCTHLNDALRALSDVAALLAVVEAALAN